jgi:hypothetical protein
MVNYSSNILDYYIYCGKGKALVSTPKKNRQFKSREITLI